MKIDSSTVAVVTGGASGLGLATARLLASKGAKVAIFDFNEEQGIARAEELGGVFCKVDVTSDEQVDAGFAKARAALGWARSAAKICALRDVLRATSSATPCRGPAVRATRATS